MRSQIQHNSQPFRIPDPFVPQLDTPKMALGTAAPWGEESTWPRDQNNGAPGFYPLPSGRARSAPKLVYITVSRNNFSTQQATSHKPISRFGVQKYFLHKIYTISLFFSMPVIHDKQLYLHLCYGTQE